MILFELDPSLDYPDNLPPARLTWPQKAPEAQRAMLCLSMVNEPW
ncbi:hypothetical protein [Marinobacter sp. 1-3A]|nr:hypothetical protein [Marinobacter sp. 1-3A]